jgi:hypothetical protein
MTCHCTSDSRNVRTGEFDVIPMYCTCAVTATVVGFQQLCTTVLCEHLTAMSSSLSWSSSSPPPDATLVPQIPQPPLRAQLISLSLQLRPNTRGHHKNPGDSPCSVGLLFYMSELRFNREMYNVYDLVNGLLNTIWPKWAFNRAYMVCTALYLAHIFCLTADAPYHQIAPF